ncbi:hypothetical protein RB213_012681 [Colletotrichum asianum]
MREVFDSYIKILAVWRSKNLRTDFMVSLITGSANVLGWDIESFGKALWNLESPFEINLYNLHIQARKLESNDPLFTKYQVVETEPEMDRFGMDKSQLSKPYKHKSSEQCVST